MAFFEGYLPTVRNGGIEPCLLEFSRPETVQHSCEPCWSDDSLIPETGDEYSIGDCVKLLIDGKLANFDFEYRKDHGRIVSHQKLIFSAIADDADLTIICFADWILSSGSPKETVKKAVEEMRCIRGLLGSDALYIGPDGLDPATGNCLRID